MNCSHITYLIVHAHVVVKVHIVLVWVESAWAFIGFS
jgi:hypothetical protein